MLTVKRVIYNIPGVKMSYINYFVESWANKDKSIHTIEDILWWIYNKNKITKVNIRKSSLSSNGFWFYDSDSGFLRNKNNSFFKVTGLQKKCDDKILHEQPIIIQDEIGYLGILCKVIDGVLYFLMQAKIEPGNVNKVQLSPTIQATKSNFMQKHGGEKPAYLDYFINAENHNIIVDQIQSEQSSRFLRKRNRNMIIAIDEDIEVLDSHKWMTLGQIKELMKIDNLVNMDTRAVLSCIPFYKAKPAKKLFKDKALYHSIYNDEDYDYTTIFRKVNNYKMFDETKLSLVPLHDLATWTMQDNEISSKDNPDFKVVFCDIEIEGREIKKWAQPLFEAMGSGLFGLFSSNDSGVKKFLVKLSPEIGCFDKVELGPTVQLEPLELKQEQDSVGELFLRLLSEKKNIRYDVILSEEGGRFYHEENRNVMIEIEKGVIEDLPAKYVWVDYKTLNILVQFNNILNIQLRNLLSLLEV